MTSKSISQLRRTLGIYIIIKELQNCLLSTEYSATSQIPQQLSFIFYNKWFAHPMDLRQFDSQQLACEAGLGGRIVAFLETLFNSTSPEKVAAVRKILPHNKAFTQKFTEFMRLICEIDEDSLKFTSKMKTHQSLYAYYILEQDMEIDKSVAWGMDTHHFMQIYKELYKLGQQTSQTSISDADRNKLLKLLEEILKFVPNYAPCWMLGASLYAAQGNWKYERTMLTGALKCSDKLWSALVSRERINRHQGNYTDALLDLNELLELDPDDVFLLARRGMVYRQLKQFELARIDLKKAIVNYPKDWFAHVILGDIQELEDDINKAITSATKLIEHTPGDCSGFLIRAGLYQQQGNFNDAILDLEDAARTLEKEKRWAFEAAEVKACLYSDEPADQNANIPADVSLYRKVYDAYLKAGFQGAKTTLASQQYLLKLKQSIAAGKELPDKGKKLKFKFYKHNDAWIHAQRTLGKRRAAADGRDDNKRVRLGC